MDSTSWLGLIFGILVSVWANKRGYAWWAFILASPIIGVIALGILPNLNEPGKVFENKDELVKKGNITGLWISGLTLAVLMIMGAIIGANN